MIRKGALGLMAIAATASAQSKSLDDYTVPKDCFSISDLEAKGRANNKNAEDFSNTAKLDSATFTDMNLKITKFDACFASNSLVGFQVFLANEAGETVDLDFVGTNPGNCDSVNVEEGQQIKSIKVFHGQYVNALTLYLDSIEVAIGRSSAGDKSTTWEFNDLIKWSGAATGQTLNNKFLSVQFGAYDQVCA